VRPWLKPWNAEHAAGRITRPLRGNGIPYQGINVLMLWAAAVEKGYAAPIWMAFKQALDLKANVRRGEYGSLVVYADKIIRTETDSETGEESDCAIPFMKGYSVVNVEQIDGLPEHYYAKPEARTDSVQRIAHAESFFAATGANLVHGGSRACYVPSTDNIHMPCIDFFCDAESYYATLAHETTHNAEPRIMPRRPEFSRETRAESTGQCGIIGAMPVRQIDSKGVKAVASRRRM
jgi:antirestriction protein ArdC